MTDLERLFRLMVQQLAATDPARLHRPLTVAELTGDVVPYRSSRRVLAIETAEDHDALLLRLLSGEGNFVHLMHDDVRRRFELEARSANAELDVLREFSKAQFLITAEALARTLGDGIIVAPIPQPPAPPPRPPAPLPPAAAFVSSTAITPPARPSIPKPVIGAVVDIPLDAVRLSMPELDDLVARHTKPPTPPSRPSRPVERNTRPVERIVPAATSCSYCGGGLPAGRAVHFCPHCGQSQTVTLCPGCGSEVEIGWRHCVNCGSAV